MENSHIANVALRGYISRLALQLTITQMIACTSAPQAMTPCADTVVLAALLPNIESELHFDILTRTFTSATSATSDRPLKLPTEPLGSQNLVSLR